MEKNINGCAQEQVLFECMYRERTTQRSKSFCHFSKEIESNGYALCVLTS